MGFKDVLDIAASVITVAGFIFAAYKWVERQSPRASKPPSSSSAKPPVEAGTGQQSHPQRPNISYSAAGVALRWGLGIGLAGVLIPAALVTGDALAGLPWTIPGELGYWLVIILVIITALTASISTVLRTGSFRAGLAAGLIAGYVADVAGLVAFDVGADMLGAPLAPGFNIVLFIVTIVALSTIPFLVVAALGALVARIFAH
ncbi:MAG TPA: hypothetical protein VH349_10780 [Ktedonobacterales bacterium]